MLGCVVTLLLGGALQNSIRHGCWQVPLLAKFFATVAGLGWNFFANHVWNFCP